MPIGHGVFSSVGKLGQANPLQRYEPRVEEIGAFGLTKSCWTQTDKKSFVVMEQGRPYRKPPLVGWDKSPKALEITSAKELDKRAL